MSYICTPKESLCLIALTKRAAEKRPNKYNMEAKEAIVKIIKALLEIGEPVQRQLLIDYLLGRRNRQVEELALCENDTFGIGESNDEDYWSTVIDAAYEGELLKQMASKKNALTNASGMVISHMEKISQIKPILPSPPALNTEIIPIISTPENGQIAANTSIKFPAYTTASGLIE